MVKAKDESSSLIGDVILMTSFSVWTGTNGDVHTVPVTMLSTRPISATQAATATPTATQPPNSGGLGIPAAVAIFTWPTSKTFLGGYLPILMAKLFQMSWGSLHTHINGLTPFSHLASPQGASAGELSGPGFSTWYVSVAYSAVWIMTPIASETIWFDTNYQCSNPDLNNPSNPCWPPRMSVNSPIVRVLQTLLTLVAVVTLAIIVLWFRKPSGCSGDPTSIAAVAQLMGHPEVVRDFQNLDAEMTEKELEVFLKDKRYKLDMYQTATGAQRYGIVPAPLDGRPTQEVLQIPHDIDSSPRVIRNILAGWKSLATYADAIFVFFLLGLLSIVAAYVKGGANSRLTKLFETDSVGRRLFFAILACVAAAKWGRIQRDTQTFAPYMRLNQPDAPAAPTILLRKHTLPLTSFIPMIKNRHFIPASIAFTALLSEFLVVVLSGLPYRPGQLRSEFLFCGITSLVILSAMFVMLGVFTVWRKALPHLPRKPDSVAKVMTYVCHSRMNDDFEGMEALSMKERDKKIMALKKRYKYSLLIKEDGRRAWVVDEMEQQPLLESKNALEEGREQTEFWRWARAAA
ncbi:hypothetical protein AOQ84DRAFT_226305 [Glonium stellatum]|uniref:Uncharacterized protein n=1 Tax=Glonium stellatum TaxID=574774 RepID=A0A8E2F9N8_9PEZI|nr:hypothetical protein AOQ84DRAFT_226305 [Glonium stellatum]